MVWVLSYWKDCSRPVDALVLLSSFYNLRLCPLSKVICWCYTATAIPSSWSDMNLCPNHAKMHLWCEGLDDTNLTETERWQDREVKQNHFPRHSAHVCVDSANIPLTICAHNLGLMVSDNMSLDKKHATGLHKLCQNWFTTKKGTLSVHVSVWNVWVLTGLWKHPSVKTCTMQHVCSTYKMSSTSIQTILVLLCWHKQGGQLEKKAPDIICVVCNKLIAIWAQMDRKSDPF